MIGISASGEGDIYVDWGDNAEIERITLSSSYKYYSHILTSDTTVNRRIRLFGDFKLYDLDLSDLYPNKILSFAPLHMESIKINGATKLSGIDFMQMVDPKGLIEIGFIKCRLNDLSPLIDLKNAHTINLGYCNIGSGVMDKYLIGLVEKLWDKEKLHHKSCRFNIAIRRVQEAGCPTPSKKAGWRLSGYWLTSIRNQVVLGK
mgnify:CR=1 FL=1